MSKKEECSCLEDEGGEDECIEKYKKAYLCYSRHKKNPQELGSCLSLYREMKSCYSSRTKTVKVPLTEQREEREHKEEGLLRRVWSRARTFRFI